MSKAPALSVYTEEYTEYVIQQLIGIKGKSKSDVASFILKDWIGDHQDELDKMEISVQKAKKEGILDKN